MTGFSTEDARNSMAGPPRPRTIFVFSGEFLAVSKVAAKMNLSLRDWVYIPDQSDSVQVFKRFEPEGEQHME